MSCRLPPFCLLFLTRVCKCVFQGARPLKWLFLLILVECLCVTGRGPVFALCGFPPAVEGLPQHPLPSLQPAEWAGDEEKEQLLFTLRRNLKLDGLVK